MFQKKLYCVKLLSSEVVGIDAVDNVLACFPHKCNVVLTSAIVELQSHVVEEKIVRTKSVFGKGVS